MKLNKIPIRVYFTPNNYLETTVELYDTCDDIKYQIMAFLNIPKEYHTLFAFYETISDLNTVEEVFIEDFVRLSDVLGTFEFKM